MAPPDVATLLSRLDPAVVQPPRRNAFELFVSIGFEFAVSVVVTGIIGAVVLSVAPDFTRDGVEYLHKEPGEAFLYGLGAYVITVVVTILLAITIVGILVVIPGLVVLAILGLGATTVSVISFGSWLRSAVGGGGVTEYGTALVVGAFAWAAVSLVPVLGALVTFVVGTMGYGYLALWLLNGPFDRNHGSYDGSGSGGTTRKARDRYDPHGERDVGDRGKYPGGEDRNDDSDRFRNIAAVDAEREEGSEADTTAGEGTTNRDDVSN